MNIVTEINQWRSIRKELIGRKIGLVHTMGNLHEGHLSLCRRSRKENEITVAVIFINPTQFNQASDFELYPRTLAQDKTLLSNEGVDYLLLFDAEQLYPDHYQVQVSETDISRILEGEFRPGHFTGMLTIVLKVINLVQPVRSYYGEKDYQQLELIRKMADALFLPVEIIGCETVRAHDGLALSSRNNRLTPEQRKKAGYFPALLQCGLPCDEIATQLERHGLKVDYIADHWQRRLGAVWVDEVRLIDNIIIK